ncbi:MAG: hypothetical protein IPJ85_12005 [Flavobacteriales bacterium]|nr:hypothetical protein [Flavobacteriales bacterium]
MARRILRWLGRAALIIFSLVMILAGLLLLPAVQSAVASWLASWASDHLGVEVRISQVAITLDGSVALREVYVEDLRGDTLFWVPDLELRGLRVHPRSHLVQLTSLDIQGARFKLGMAEGDERSNLTLLLEKLESDSGYRRCAGMDHPLRSIQDRSVPFHLPRCE